MTLADQHAWARFGVGSWKLVRLSTETIGENGEVESVTKTDTKTTLSRADDRTYTLKVEVTVEVAGKRFDADPKEITYGYNGEEQGQTVTVKDLGESKVSINGFEYPSVVRQIEIQNEKLKSVSTTHYSERVSPHILKRKTEAIDTSTDKRTYLADVAVIAMDMPERVLTEIKSTTHVRRIETYADGTRKITVEVLCDSVPGGLIAHALKQVNEAGVVVQRSTLELIDYQNVAKPATPAKVQPAAGRRGLFKKRKR